MIAEPIAEATEVSRMSRLQDVAKLVRENPAQLILREQLADARRNRDRRVLGVAARGAKASGCSWGIT